MVHLESGQTASSVSGCKVPAQGYVCQSFSGEHTMLTVYGIPNCTTVKKARAWLDAQGLPHVFHDFKKQGVPAERLDSWVNAAGWEVLINRQGTTWRQLDESVKQSIVDASSGKTLMLAHPSVIKRPVFERNGALLGVGFTPAVTSILAAT